MADGTEPQDNSLTRKELNELIDEVTAGGGGFREYMERAEAIQRMRDELSPTQGEFSRWDWLNRQADISDAFEAGYLAAQRGVMTENGPSTQAVSAAKTADRVVLEFTGWSKINRWVECPPDGKPFTVTFRVDPRTAMVERVAGAEDAMVMAGSGSAPRAVREGMMDRVAAAVVNGTASAIYRYMDWLIKRRTGGQS